jgi:hypothetical protein
MPNEYLEYIYSPEWRIKSKQVQRLTFNHCILFPWMKSNHAHHLTYKNLKKELPIRDIIPVSKCAHDIIHRPILWKTPLRFLVNFLLRSLMILWIMVWFIILFNNKHRLIR